MSSLLFDTGLSISLWNALKFLLLQILVSLFFGRLWVLFIRRRAENMICQGRVVTVFSSGIGRLSPAHIMAFDAQSDIGPCRLPAAVSSRLILILANVVLFASLLVAEYGSDAIPVFRALLVNSTSLDRHPMLVDDIINGRQNLDTLYPLKLLPDDDYKYEVDREHISIGLRVRNMSSNSFLHARSRRHKVALCGMLSSPCEHADKLNGAGGMDAHLKVFEVHGAENLRAKFHGAHSIAEELFISSSVREIGWIDSASSRVVILPSPKTFSGMTCVMKTLVSSFIVEYDSYEQLHCGWREGNFIHFFAFKSLDSNDQAHNILFRAYPEFQNRSGVRYVIAERDGRSMFGVDKDFVPSKTVALLQILHYPNILHHVVNGTDVGSLLQVLKEQNVWAILGMVSGNSKKEQVDIETSSFHAAVDELFICGVGAIVLFCCLLLAYSFIARCGEKYRLSVPVSDAELLKQLRASDVRQHRALVRESDWPTLCTRSDAEKNNYLSFCGPPQTA